MARDQQQNFGMRPRPSNRQRAVLEQRWAFICREFARTRIMDTKESFDYTSLAEDYINSLDLAQIWYSRPLGYQARKGRFTMIYHEQARRVRRRIREGPSTETCSQLWLLCTETADWDTGFVPLTRAQIAKECEYTIDQVSRGMKLLHEYGAVYTLKEGGRSVYVCDGTVGWHGPRESEAQKDAWWLTEEGERRLAKLAMLRGEEGRQLRMTQLYERDPEGQAELDDLNEKARQTG